MTGGAPRRRDEGGYVLVTVAFLVLILAGINLGMIQEGLAARGALDRHEHNLRAIEVAEAGIVRAEMEIRAQTDLDGNGIGVVSGELMGGTYEVAIRDDPVSADRWVLTATGVYRLSTRRFEVGVRRRRNSMHVDALFSVDDLVLSNTTTDAYDSRVGTYASQAVNVDGGGSLALPGGHIGSNADVHLDGTSVWVRGNAIPGVFRETYRSGSPTVTGDMAPREFDLPVEPVPMAEFVSAMNTNANGSIAALGHGNNLRYNQSRMTLDLTGNVHAVLPGGTYFFKEVFVRGGCTLSFSGPTKLYVTGGLQINAGGHLLAGQPADLEVFAHPYPLPSGSIATTTVDVQGGSQVHWALHAPGAVLKIGGGNDFFGAAIAGTVEIQGTNAFHYDRALGEVEIGGVAWMERLFWRELSPPRR